MARKLPHPALPTSLKPITIAPQQTTPANPKQPQAQKPKEGDANKDANKDGESKPSAPKPVQTVDLTKDREDDESDEESDDEDMFEDGDCQDILDSDVAFISSFKVVVFLTHHEHAFKAIDDDHTDVGDEALPALPHYATSAL